MDLRNNSPWNGDRHGSHWTISATGIRSQMLVDGARNRPEELVSGMRIAPAGKDLLHQHIAFISVTNLRNGFP